MPIRKFGTEPAKTEIREEDNDRDTLNSMSEQRDPDGKKTAERKSDDQQQSS